MRPNLITSSDLSSQCTMKQPSFPVEGPVLYEWINLSEYLNVGHYWQTQYGQKLTSDSLAPFSLIYHSIRCSIHKLYQLSTSEQLIVMKRIKWHHYILRYQRKHDPKPILSLLFLLTSRPRGIVSWKTEVRKILKLTSILPVLVWISFRNLKKQEISQVLWTHIAHNTVEYLIWIIAHWVFRIHYLQIMHVGKHLRCVLVQDRARMYISTQK